MDNHVNLLDAYHAIVKPKLDNLVKFLDTELRKEIQRNPSQCDEEILTTMLQKYVMIKDDTITLAMVVRELLKHWKQNPETKEFYVDKEAVQAEVEEAKKKAFSVVSCQPDFDAKKWDKCVNYKLPLHVEDRVYMYYHMLCDLAVAFGLDNI